MQRNRFFKSTTGVGGEYVIAQTLDNSATPAIGIAPSAATATVTVAATPAVGDKITIFVNGEEYSYMVAAGDTTAAALNTSITALLNTNNQGFTAVGTGTTTSVFTLNATKAALMNGWVVTITLGTPNVSTFSAPTPVNFGTGGADPVSGGPQPTIALFRSTAATGSLGVYWSDTNIAVKPGETSLFANAQREFYYAWKTQDANTYVTTPIVAGTRKYFSAPYYAGQPDIWTETFTGTYTAGQLLHVTITDITSIQIPYPKYEYIVTSTGTIATDLTAIAALINAEIYDPIATAGAVGAVLTIIGNYAQGTAFTFREFKVGFYLETVGSNALAAGVDASAVAYAHTQIATFEVGTTADVLEFEKYFKTQNGIMIYTNGGTLPSELSNISQSTVVGVQYGYLVVAGFKNVTHQSSVHEAYTNKKYISIALPSTALTQLAQY